MFFLFGTPIERLKELKVQAQYNLGRLDTTDIEGKRTLLTAIEKLDRDIEKHKDVAATAAEEVI